MYTRSGISGFESQVKASAGFQKYNMILNVQPHKQDTSVHVNIVSFRKIKGGVLTVKQLCCINTGLLLPERFGHAPQVFILLLQPL